MQAGFGDISTRAAQLRRAESLIAPSSSGTLLLTGLAGMGKSALLRAITPAPGAPWQLVQFKADAFERTIPFAAAERLLHQLNRRWREQAAGGAQLAHPRQLGAVLLGELDRRRQGVFLTIDDAQWLDPESAMALRFAFHRLLDGRFFAAVASRTANEPNALVEMLAENAEGSERHAHLVVDPLTSAEVQLMAAQLLGRGISQRSAQALREATGGSPALLTAALRLSRDAVPSGAEIWEVPSPVIDAARNPFSRMIAAVAEPAGNAAAICAVLRDPVEARLFDAIAAELGLEADVSAAVAGGLVQQNSWRGEVWVGPSHELLARAVEQGMGAEQALAVHRAAGTALGGRRGLRHRLAAASRAEAALLAEVRAIARGASTPAQADEAIGYLRTLLPLAEPGPARADVLIEVALVAMRFRRQQYILDLLPQLQELPPSDLAVAITVELFAVSGRLAEALAQAGTVSGSAPGAADAESRIVRAHVAGIRAQFQLMTNDIAPLLGLVARARQLVDEVRPDDAAGVDERLRWMHSPIEQQMRLLGWAITAAARSGQTEAFRAAFAELAELIARAEPSPELIDALVTRAGILMQTGDVVGVHHDMLRARTMLERFPHAWTAGHVRVILTQVDYLLGDWEGSLACAENALSLAMDETAFSIRPVTHFAAALVAASRGSVQEVAALVETGERARVSRHESYESTMAVVVQAELARATGSPVEQLRVCSDPGLRTLVSTTHGWMGYRVEALVALGRLAEARAALLELREAAAVRWQPYYGSIAWLEARIADAADKRKTAKLLYEQALAEPTAPVFPFRLAITRADYGRFLLRVGDNAAARVQLEAAAAVFSRLGAAPDLERALALLERAGGTGAGVPEDPFAALTARERQIAHHAARGHTNREIADSLFLSVTTVNFHMRNVLPKLGLSSRRQLRTLTPS